MAKRNYIFGFCIPALYATSKFHEDNIAIGQHLQLQRITTTRHENLTLKTPRIIRSSIKTKGK